MPNINDQIAADLDAVFFAEGGIGVVAGVYRSADGTVVRTVNGIFDNEYAEVVGENAGVAGRRPVFDTKEANWPETWQVAVGGTLEVQVDPQTATVYTIRRGIPDGTGRVLLVLEEP